MKLTINTTKKIRHLKQGDVVENKHTGDIGLIVKGFPTSECTENPINIIKLTPNVCSTQEDIPKVLYADSSHSTNQRWEDWKLLIPRENVEITIKQGE